MVFGQAAQILGQDHVRWPFIFEELDVVHAVLLEREDAVEVTHTNELFLQLLDHTELLFGQGLARLISVHGCHSASGRRAEYAAMHVAFESGHLLEVGDRVRAGIELADCRQDLVHDLVLRVVVAAVDLRRRDPGL